MQFVVFATDRPDRLLDRVRVREEHRARLRDPGPHEVRVLLAGPTLDAAGQVMNGSLLVVDAVGLDAVRAFIADDPYVREGVYGDVVIRPWHCGIGQLGPERAE